MMKLGSLMFAVAMLAACGGNKNEARAPRSSKYKGVHAFYPFETGMQWSYSVRGPGAPMGILKVDKVIAERNG